jgi:hypothetical protein
MDLLQPNFRSSHYSIAQLSVDCWFCGASTRVVAVVLPNGHETLDEPDEQGNQSWRAAAGNALLFFIDQVPRSVQVHLRLLAPGFQQAWSDEAEDTQWANHCEHCDELLDDDELHCEPGGTFMPMTEAQGAKIRLIKILEPLEAAASGYSPEPEFVRFRQRA